MVSETACNGGCAARYVVLGWMPRVFRARRRALEVSPAGLGRRRYDPRAGSAARAL